MKQLLPAVELRETVSPDVVLFEAFTDVLSQIGGEVTRQRPDFSEPRITPISRIRKSSNRKRKTEGVPQLRDGIAVLFLRYLCKTNCLAAVIPGQESVLSA